MLSVILTAFQFSMKIQKTVLLYGFRKTKKEKNGMEHREDRD